MDTSACAQCGEEILPQWIVCPVCTHPTESTDALIPPPEPNEIISTKISCLQCQANISPEDLTCSNCHVPIIRRYCSSCKRLIPDHVLFCPYCGATPARKRALKNFVKAGGVGLVFGLLMLIFLLYYRSHSSDSSNSPKPLPIAEKKEPKQFEAFLQPQVIEQASEANSLLTFESTVLPKASVPFDAIDLAPPIPTNTVVKIATIPEPPVDFLARGARLMQGRKLSLIGAHYMRSGQYKQAVIVLRKAIETFPPKTSDTTYGESLYHLGYSLRMAGRPEEAIPVLKLALKFPLYNSKVTKELKTASAQIKKSR